MSERQEGSWADDRGSDRQSVVGLSPGGGESTPAAGKRQLLRRLQTLRVAVQPA